MPTRMVDGESVWGSNKLNQLPEEFKSEYANWVPLAEANGVFEVNIGRIYQRIYAYNRKTITITTVEQIFHEFKKVDLLRTWEENGKVYGWWVGIDRPGLLPGPAHQKRYKNMPPNPPASVVKGPAVVSQNTIELEEPEEVDMGAKKNIEVASLKILGVQLSPQDPRWWEISALNRAYGADKVLEAFETWAEQQRGRTLPYPLSEFVRVAPGFLSGVVQGVQDTPELDDLCSDLYVLGDQAFTGKHRAAVAKLLESYTAAELVTAYKEFIADRDQFQMRFTPRDFVEGAAKDIIVAGRKRRLELQKQEELLKRTEQSMLEQHAKEETAVEEEPIDTELPEA